MSLICVICGNEIVQPKSGPKRTLYCSKKCLVKSPKYVEYKRLYDIKYREGNKNRVVENRVRYAGTDRSKYLNKLASLRNNFRLTEEEYVSIVNLQQGCCDICNASLDDPHVDHCHDTGRVRGLLCKNCNTAIGMLKEDINIMLNAIIYMKKHGC